MALKIESCYTDFKISARGSRLTDCLDTAAKLGYGRVAVDLQVNVTSKKVNLPRAKELDELIAQANPPKGLEVLKRITMSLEDGQLLHYVQGSPVLDEYDITALHCGNEKVFQTAVTSISTDLISLEWGERLGFAMRHTQVSQIIDKGTMFEFCYTPAIKDSTQRCNLISNILDLSANSKGKGIIVSSGAEQDIELRGPLDIINLCHLFGMKTEQCKATITANCVQVISHTRQRKEIVKGAVSCHLLTEYRKRVRCDDEVDDHDSIDKKNNFITKSSDK